jgi:hypothetical protein
VKKTILLAVFLILARNLYSADLQISDKETDFYFTPEYNRAFDFCWDISALGRIKLNGQHTVKAGLALGTAGNVFELKGFVGGEAALPVGIPLFICLAYNYNGLPEYEYHAHSLPLLISFQGKRISASLGTNFRLASFLGESPIFEPVPVKWTGIENPTTFFCACETLRVSSNRAQKKVIYNRNVRRNTSQN